MPTYEYRCPKCGDFEVEQRMTDAALIACPTCGEPVKRLMPRKLYIQFKGPGFHVNDYPSNHRPVPAAETSPAKTESTSGDAKRAASEH